MEPSHSPHKALSHLSKTFEAISRFNQNFSAEAYFATSLANMIRYVVSPDIKNAELLREQSLYQHESSATSEAERIFNECQKGLTTIGLELSMDEARSDLAKTLLTLSEQNEEQNPEQPTKPKLPINHALTLSLLSPSDFITFVETLKPIDCRGESPRRTIASLVRAIESEVERRATLYQLKISNDSNRELYRAAEVLSVSLAELGMKDLTSTLATKLEHAWQDRLYEYIIASCEQILPEPNGYRPHNWHLDCTPERYQSKWARALDTLEQVAENPNAVTITQEAKRYLQESIITAEQYFRSLKTLNTLSPQENNQSDEFLNILKELEDRLALIRPSL